MEQFYKKVDKIDEKVKEASMPYMQWKVLFLVGDNTTAEEISSLLEEDESAVQDILTSLESKNLIEKIDDTKTDTSVEKQPEDTSIASIGDELLVEEEEVISQVDEQLDSADDEVEEETPETEESPGIELEEIGTELVEDISLEPDMISDEENLPAEESTSEDTISPDDFSLPEESEITEEQAVEDEESSKTEDLTLADDEFDLSLDEPDIVTAEHPQTEVATDEVAEQKPVEVEVPDEEIISDSTKKTIMVIDDSIVIRKMIEIALEEEDFNIITAISGKEGLETIEKAKPNLVILDMMLPDMNGIEVLKTIKGDKNLPVIMLSGKDSPQLIETAKEIGVDDFLPKPFRDEELVEKVKTLIED